MVTAALPRVKSRLLVFAPFLVIAALFALTDVLAMRHVSELRAETEHVVEDMLADIQRVGRMRYDLDRVKLLADQHVFEKEAAAMAGLDARIALLRADYAVAAAAYDAQPMLPDERATWQALKGEVAMMGPRLDAVLALSRLNDDLGAHRGLVALEGDFDAANGDLRTLIEVNSRAADEAVRRVGALQQTSTASLQLLALAGIGLSVALGVATAGALRLREQRLRHYSTMLEASNRELDAFAGRVAHDLRGPLSTASLAVVRLSSQSPSPDQVKTVGVLQRSFERMGAIIQDLLAISRMQAGARVAECDPAEAAEELREDLGPRAEGSGVSLLIDVQHASVRCTEGLLRQVMWNLADNAMRYRRAEVPPRVEICGRPAGDRYELTVQDNGVGIAPEDVGKVFDPFYRAAGAGGEPGTGLGLSIVKRVVECNGGSVTVTSQPGRGSRFVTRLPLA